MKKNYLIICFSLSAVALTVVFLFLVKNVLAVGGGEVIMTVKILVCGDEVREGWEQCDRGDLGGQSCVSLGYTSGTLACAPACEFNTSACVLAPSCGNGSCSGSENCSNCPTDCGTCPGSGGGGGGTSYVAPITPVTSVIFSGRAYPNSAVTLLKDAQIAATTVAGADANFKITLAGLSAGSYIFSVYSEDKKGNRSSLLSFPISLTIGATTQVSGIFITPTIAVDKSQAKHGENIAIFGQSVPNSEITISVNSDEEFFNKTKADAGGVYLYNFDTTPLEIGQHLTKSKAVLGGEISSFGRAVSFAVGEKNVAAEGEKKAIEKKDLNNDNRVNLIDFSIMAYWYKRPSPPPKVDLNSDGKVNLVDLSIMAYYWTG